MKKFSIVLFLILVLIAIVGIDQGARIIVQLKGGLLNKVNTHQKHNVGFDYNYQSLDFYSKDSLLLKAQIIRTDVQKTKGTILFVHGIRAYKEHFVPKAMELNQAGYDVVVYDQRAHGESEGKYCTFGYYEKEDVSSLLDRLQYQDVSQNIGVWGQSLGAAVALQAMGSDPRINFGIIESTFSDMRLVTYDYAERIIGFRSEILIDLLLWRAEQIADFEVDIVKPYEYAELVQKPILMVHGTIDGRIKFEYGQKNYEHVKSTRKEFLAIDSAHHLNVWSVGGEEYFQKVLNFIPNN